MNLSFKVPTFKKTIRRLNYLKTISMERDIYRAADAGLKALRNSTPVKTGDTAGSWYYIIVPGDETYTIEWHNTATAGDIPLVVLLDIGHGTGTGGYVNGLHFIGPAVKPIFANFREAVNVSIGGRL